MVVHTAFLVWWAGGLYASLDKRVSVIESTRYSPQMAAEGRREVDQQIREIGGAVHRMETAIAGANLSGIELKLEKIEAKMTKDLDAMRLEIRSLDARGCQ